MFNIGVHIGVHWLKRKAKQSELDVAYQQGVSRGYALGYSMGQIESSNRGYITGRDVLAEAEKIRRMVQEGE